MSPKQGTWIKTSEPEFLSVSSRLSSSPIYYYLCCCVHPTVLGTASVIKEFLEKGNIAAQK